MLKNEQQLSGAMAKLSMLLDSFSEDLDEEGRAALRRMVTEVQLGIQEYVAVRDRQQREFPFASLDELGPAVVKARIYRGLTQEALAQRLEVSAQQVGKDESRGYQVAGVAKVADVVDALEFEVTGCVRPKEAASATIIDPFQAAVSRSASASSYFLVGDFLAETRFPGHDGPVVHSARFNDHELIGGWLNHAIKPYTSGRLEEAEI